MKVAILGYGNIGKKLYELLKNDYEITGILDNRTTGDLFTSSMEDIINKKPDTIFECLPNIPVAFKYQMMTLNSGINLISSNKAIVQSHYKELLSAANKNHVNFSFEAAVAGGIPFLHTILDAKKHDTLTGIKGIFNGTTNYILDSIFNNEMTYQNALDNAIKLGYAEQNYSSDIDGDDVAYKVSLASSLAFDSFINKEEIIKYGIRYLNDLVLEFAKKENRVIKLIGYADKENAFVLPMLIKKDNIFANIPLNYNCVEILSLHQDSIKLIGQGAGGIPTADAMVSDLIRPFGKLTVNDDITLKNNKKFKFVISDGNNLRVTEEIEINKLKELIQDKSFIGGIYD